MRDGLGGIAKCALQSVVSIPGCIIWEIGVRLPAGEAFCFLLGALWRSASCTLESIGSFSWADNTSPLLYSSRSLLPAPHRNPHVMPPQSTHNHPLIREGQRQG